MLFANFVHESSEALEELISSCCALRKSPRTCDGYYIDAELRGGSNGEVFRVVGETLAVEKQLASDEGSQKKCTTSQNTCTFLTKLKGFLCKIKGFPL